MQRRKTKRALLCFTGWQSMLGVGQAHSDGPCLDTDGQLVIHAAAADRLRDLPHAVQNYTLHMLVV